MGHWFPRPDTLACLVSGPQAPAARTLWRLLMDPAAESWQHKVGVRGLAEGSAKTSTRLLCVRDFVFKTDRNQSYDSAAAALAKAPVSLQQRLSIWHPAKRWFALASQERWFLVSICPRLYTLRSRPLLNERLEGWLEMYRLGCRVLLEHGLELDLNPANFAAEPTGGPLWYLDDEVYAGDTAEVLGRSLAHRISESVDVPASAWAELGRRLRGTFDARVLGELRAGLEDAPLWGRAAGFRQSLLKALQSSDTARRDAGKRQRLTCILADIHANLPALEAVLAAAREMAVDDYLLLGDYVGYGPEPEACIQRLAELPLLAALRGNHDQAVLNRQTETHWRDSAVISLTWTWSQLSPAALNWLETCRLSWRDGPVMAVHGSLANPLEGYIYTMTYADNLAAAGRLGLQALFFGHSHYPLVYFATPDGPQESLAAVVGLNPSSTRLINPGSVGQPRDRDPRSAFAIWEQTTGQVHLFRQAYDIGRTVRELRRQGLPPRLAERLREGF